MKIKLRHILFFIFVFLISGVIMVDNEILGTYNEPVNPKVLYDSLLTEGFNFLTLNNPTMAITYFKKAHKISKTPEVYAGLGMAYFRKVVGTVSNENNLNQFQSIRTIQNIKSSIKFFEQAVKLAPDDFDFKYNLAKSYLVRGDFGSLQSALNIFKELKEKNSPYNDVDLEMARIYRKIDQPDKSAEILRDIMDVGADSSAGLYEMMKLFMSQNNFEKASYYYLLALENTAEEGELPLLFKDVKLIFTPQDNAEFQQSEHKGRYVKRFWRLKDPTPMTPENEHLVEHMRRVAYAESIFKGRTPDKLYDERGEIYIRYGEPAFRYQSTGSDIVYPNESWVYELRFSERGGQLFFDFVNSGFGFKQAHDLREAMFRRSEDYSEWIALYQDRDYIYPELYQKIWEKFTQDKVGGIFAIETELERIEMIKEFNKNDSPPAVFQFDFGGEKVFNVAYTGAYFKGYKGNTRVELYYVFPLDELYFEPDPSSRTMKTIVEREISLRNIDLEYLYTDKSELEVGMELTYDVKGRISIGQINFDISPMETDPVVNLNFKSKISNRVGLYYYDLKPRDFRGSGLMLSDIEFSDDIQPTTKKDHFTKNGLRVIPHISEIVYKKIPLFVYFEIYNLKQDKNGDARYRIDYIVSRRGVESIEEITKRDTLGVKLPESLTREKNYIAVSKDYVKNVKDAFEFLSFELSTLAVGSYVFSIRVVDKETGISSVSKRNFTLKD